MGEAVNVEMPTISEEMDDDWISRCGLCEASFVIRAVHAAENPSPSGAFCPDCKARRHIAPGVLHWRRRAPLKPKEPSHD